MCKKWGYYVRSVCALCCIFCMLFSNTLLVKAASTVSGTKTFSITLTPDNSISVIMANSTGSYSSSTENGYHLDYEVTHGIDLGALDTDYVKVRFSSLSTSVSAGYGGAYSYWINRNACSGTMFFSTSQLYNGSSYILPITVKGHWSGEKYGSSNNDFPEQGVTVTFSYNLSVDSATPEEVSSGGTPVTDVGTQQELSNLNETETDTNETTHSIFDSISDFFGSFFSNLIGVFVPDSGYFEQWFSRVNTLLTDKLGILYFPFSFFIGFLTDIQSGLNSGSGVITFPAIEFKNLATNETYHFTDAIQVNLGQFNPTFSSGDVNSPLVGRQYYFDNLLRTVRTINSMFVVVSLLMLFVRKLLLIIRGSEEEDN